MIYFIQSESGPIKIGYTRSPSQRLTNLQISNPEKLVLLGVVSGGRDKEADLHERFAHLSLAGEWFKAEQDLMDYIQYSREELTDETRPILTTVLADILSDLGRNIRLARLRRKMTIQALADEMGVGIRALTNVESGDPGTSIANYLLALAWLGLSEEFKKLAKDDPHGRMLQDHELLDTKGRS